MLSEPDGTPSSMRALNLIIVVVVLGVWAMVSVETVKLQPLSPEMTLIVLGSLGIKAFQRGKETSSGGSAPPFSPEKRA